MKKLLRTGAEAKVYSEKGILSKERVKKSYRICAIDEQLRKRRTKAEAKLLEKARALGVLVPKVVSIEKYSITMELVDGVRLKDVLDKGNALLFAKKLGRMIAVLHKNDIIHGDITTSNAVVNKKEIYLVDFGLGYVSRGVEDKAVDLHLLESALESTHSKLKDKFFTAFCESYKKEYADSKKVFARLEEIRQRGRYVER